METVKEIFQSIYDSYRDRIKSPFVGSFILSYLIFNWKILAILFYSDWPIHCRIEWIEDQYCNWRNHWENYLIPFLIALFYVLGLPYINLGFDKVLKYYDNSKFEKKNTAKIDKLKQKVLEAAEERKVADAKAGTSEISHLKERNEALQLENSTLTKQNQEDLDRHNKSLEQFRKRENEYQNQIKVLTVQSQFFLKNNPLIVDGNVKLENVKEMIIIGEKFNDLDKQNYINFVKSFEANPDNISLPELKKYEKLGLIAPITNFGITQTKMTMIGLLLFEYLNNGLDLQ
ncbi:hypothetical protein [Flavobacterium sp. 245]|uniref:hypothetical protein n=1 Tax=Flavobacterium sp. 245 TaxID=2512115 RepID=UPI0010602890|nr:hypothetical protein [Flavobacterium sp. 245]TDP04070.1 hypothetical protein EV145_101471 [Flavobacterium sp. 245]